MQTGDSEVILLLTNHVLRLRQNPRFRHTLLVFFLEANMDWTKADRYGNEFMKPIYGPGPVYIVRRDESGKNRMGFFTSPATKQRIADLVTNSFVSKSIVYAKDFNSVDEEGFKREFEGELKYFRREYKVLDDPNFQQPKEVITGKGRSNKDDGVMALGFCFEGWEWLVNDRQGHFWQQAERNGWQVPIDERR